MRKAYKYRIYLTNGQHRILAEQLEECRWVYNEVLAARKLAYEERGESLRLYDTINLLPVWKLSRPTSRACILRYCKTSSCAWIWRLRRSFAA